MGKLKRVAAIHDISGFGKCSLTIALPILSAMGIETDVMPTAVLSAHTGFDRFTYRDLTEDLSAFKEHWKEIGMKFDAVYSGFLGSLEQIEIVKDFIREFKTPDTLVLVDPAMADFGEMYTTFDMDFANEMKSLCEVADIIVPNFTEATFMLGLDYIKPPYTKEYIEKILKELSKLGPSKIVLTGADLDDKNVGAASYDSKTGEIGYAFSPKIEGEYYGTGDIFASVLLGAYLNDKSLAESIKFAVDFTGGCAKRTRDENIDPLWGVDFEHGIPELIKNLGLI